MGNITLGQIASAVALLAGLITGASVIVGQLKKWIQNVLNEKFGGIDTRLDKMEENIRKANVDSLKNYLMQEMRDIEHGEVLDEHELACFEDEYKRYTEELNENSYVKRKYKKLKDKGLI